MFTSRMREVDLGCGKALLIKQNGEYYAMGHKCPHYGAPLVKGWGLLSLLLVNISQYKKIKFGESNFLLVA